MESSKTIFLRADKNLGPQRKKEIRGSHANTGHAACSAPAAPRHVFKDGIPAARRGHPAAGERPGRGAQHPAEAAAAAEGQPRALPGAAGRRRKRGGPGRAPRAPPRGRRARPRQRGLSGAARPQRGLLASAGGPGASPRLTPPHIASPPAPAAPPGAHRRSLQAGSRVQSSAAARAGVAGRGWAVGRPPGAARGGPEAPLGREGAAPSRAAAALRGVT